MASSNPPVPESDEIPSPIGSQLPVIEIRPLLGNPVHYHTPLDPAIKSLRLLEVPPNSGYEFIRCRLVQADLDANPSYIAVSYTWDKAHGRLRYIECDDMDLLVGENLWQFLHEFRRKQFLQRYHQAEPGIKPCRLWIDAICINQSDLEERNQQVSQMRDVYSKAESVIVWLGVAQGHEELAFLLTKHPALVTVEKLWSELLDLLSKPYFTRVWVSSSLNIPCDPSLICIFRHRLSRSSFLQRP